MPKTHVNMDFDSAQADQSSERIADDLAIRIRAIVRI
jgi:hypothetical protein